MWAVVVDFGIAEVAFAVGEPHVSREAAEVAARREVQEMEQFHSPALEDIPQGVEDRTSVEQFLARGEPWAILYAPLTPTAFGVLSQMDRNSEDDFETAVLELQRDYAWELVRAAALALRRIPHLVQRRVFALAFTVCALDHQ